MNKPELVSAISLKTGFTKKNTELFLASFIETVEETVPTEKVSLVGFVSFESREVGVTSGVSKMKKDANGVVIEEPWTKEAHKAVSVKVGKGFKDAVNK